MGVGAGAAEAVEAEAEEGVDMTVVTVPSAPATGEATAETAPAGDPQGEKSELNILIFLKVFPKC